jgi:hypothetical protein
MTRSGNPGFSLGLTGDVEDAGANDFRTNIFETATFVEAMVA